MSWSNNFFFAEEYNTEKSKDTIDGMLEEFARVTTTQRKQVTCPLLFWKEYEKLFPGLIVVSRVSFFGKKVS